MIQGPAAEWLASRREELNGRFERARRRWPRLEGGSFAARLAQFLPPLAELDRGDGALLSSVFDLVLLHSGRDAFGRHPALGTLLGETLPALGTHLRAAPSLAPSLVASLSNAVEGAGARAPELARVFASLGPLVGNPAQLLDAGAVAAWRLGLARLRGAALRVAKGLPGRAVLVALDLADWPDAAAPLAVAALETDGWRPPREAISTATLKALRTASPGEVAKRAEALARPQPAPLALWAVAGRAGDFSGFGGPFDAPPELLAASGRHAFHAASAGEAFLVEADAFGWKARRVTAPFPASREAPSDVKVGRDGAVSLGKERRVVPLLAGTTSYSPFPRGVACALSHSHRLRFLVPRSVPV